MADEDHTKPGFLARLFGRSKAAPLPSEAETALGAGPPAAPPAEDKAEPAPAHQGEAMPENAVALLRELVQSAPAAPAVEALPVPPDATPVPAENPPTPAKASWWTRLTSGLSRTSSSLTTGIAELFTKRKLDGATLEDLEDILVQADLGLATSARIAAAVGQGRYDKTIAPEEVRRILAREVAAILAPVALPLVIDSAAKPFVILMVGVNGSGKTTTIGKLTARFRAEGHSVLLAAGDTFRAAAIEQLKVWGERTGAQVIAREQGADAAGLAFDALSQASRHGHRDDRHGRAVAEQDGPDGRAWQGGAGGSQAGAFRAPCRAAGAGRDRRPERPFPGGGLPRHGRRDGTGDDKARRDGAGRHIGGSRGAIRPSRAFHRGWRGR
jgi:fused signal recognition particle receptor